ncbi:hypothetical protein [Flavobacterium sp.]|jgi:hypothetical protein|uniref:hypothetical protein n=1 Tax=Flavobacterium sp. TaxID=239 RepID=UPI0022BE8098|nr:hypothetical protein [Flavobacterium sp.]MCZ8297769.1 hypothetical protein [Flavobacterium sp.]
MLFYVKETTPLGQTQLSIPSLNNTKIIYEVVEATLTQSPEATLQPLMDYQAQYGTTLTNTPEDAPFLQNHNSFSQYFANLSGEDHIKAAKFYKTNKTIFDAVFNTNYDAIQGRAANQTQADFDFQLYRSLILRHKIAVLVTVGAGTFAATPPYDPIETTLSAAVAVVGIKKSSDFHKQIIDDVFRVVQVKLNNELGLNNRMANAPNAALTLTDNQATTLPFAVNAKNFSNTDSNVQKEFVQTYFTAKNKLNGFINQLNTAINWINNNVPLLTLSTITTVEVPATAPLNSFDTNAQVMQRFTFSLNHPNLSLVNATLQSDGQLNLKVKFVGNPTATSISSTLNYTYNDDFSSFSGSFPIEVSEEDPCVNMSAPVITAVNWECDSTTNEIAILISFTADGTGILVDGGSGSCVPTGLCYPVRLYFNGPGQPGWAIASNAYEVSLKSGTVNQGVVEITFNTSNGLKRFCISGKSAYESFLEHWAPFNYEWKVELMNQCNQRSNQVNL